MASKHSGIPTSNISELNGLGATSSITLPKKRPWKIVVISLAAVLSVGGLAYYVSTLDVVRGLFSSADEIAEDTSEQDVPLAPNPELMPPEVNVTDAVPATPLVLAPVENSKPVVKVAPKKKIVAGKKGKRTLVKAKPKSKTKKVLAKTKHKKSKAIVKAKKFKPTFTQNVASQTKKSNKAQP